MNQETFLWETSGTQEPNKLIYHSIIMFQCYLLCPAFPHTKMLRTTYIQSFSALGYQTQVGINTPSAYVAVNMTYDGTTFAFSCDSTILLDVIGIN